MPNRAVEKLTEPGRNAARALSAYTPSVARPLFWHVGAKYGGTPKGASAFILKFERRLVGVTADHVIDQYLADLKADKRTICQLGTRQIKPEKSLIARSARLDIATFEIEPAMLPAVGGDTFDCHNRWPPPDVEVGDTLTLTGFRDNHRAKIAPDRYDMPAWGGHGVIDAVSEREIVTVYDPEQVLHADFAVNKPPLGFNMSGCSGGPVFLVKQIKQPAAMVRSRANLQRA